MRSVVWLLLAGLVAARGQALAAGIKVPGDIVGTWVGSCTQTETQVRSGILCNISQPSPRQLLMNYRTADIFFGCPVTDSGNYVSFKGGKANGWGPREFHIRIKAGVSELWGALQVRTRGRKVIVKGKNACNGAGPSRYSGTGTFDGGNIFTITLTAKIQTETAHFDCLWRRV